MIDFDNIKHIAIIGLSPNPDKPSHQVALYLQNKGYEIFPIYPKPQIILGKMALPNIQSLANLPIDWVVVFRKSELCEQITQEIIALHSLSIKGIWLQLGIKNPRAQALALQHGLEFIQDHCIKIEREKYEN